MFLLKNSIYSNNLNMKILHVLVLKHSCQREYVPSGGLLLLHTDKIVVLFNDGPITSRYRMGPSHANPECL